MARFDVFCSFDVTLYGRFPVLGETFDGALDAASRAIAAGDLPSLPDGARKVEVLGLRRTGGQTSLVPSAAATGGAQQGDPLAALLSTTSLLAQLLGRVDELALFRPEVDQVAANLVLLGEDARRLAAWRDGLDDGSGSSRWWPGAWPRPGDANPRPKR